MYHKTSSSFHSSGPGDVIGISIYLPPLSETSARELTRRMWDPLRTKDYNPIRTKPLEVAQSSEIRYYKNGKDLGIAFKDIYFGAFSQVSITVFGVSLSNIESRQISSRYFVVHGW
jgi:hypothetical protein